MNIVIALMIAMCFGGCAKQGNTDTQTQQTESEIEKKEYLYLIVAHDMQEESFTLYSYANGMEQYFEYGFATQFKDKYGNLVPASKFTEGRFVTIDPRDKDGYLTGVQLSDQVWEQEKVHRFQIEEERGILTIGDTKYSIRDEVKIFSNGGEITFSDISEDDVLTVIGKDRKVLSIVVTTGHGTLALNNTGLFEDSFLQLNSNIFAMITPNMELEVPEGTYTLKVANDGWGGTTEIEIIRGKTTRVDLETLKGEGKKKGMVSFEIDAEDVKVYVDHKLIDHTNPVELVYGLHVLQIKAEGYETWKKYLSVNSEEATILIELTEEESQKEDSEKEETETEKETETETEKETETEIEKETEDEKATEIEKETQTEEESQKEEQEETQEQGSESTENA